MNVSCFTLFYASFEGLDCSLSQIFVAGWYGAEVTCLIPFLLRKVENSSLVNAVLLSDTISSSNTCMESSDLNTMMVLLELAEGTIFTSSHLE